MKKEEKEQEQEQKEQKESRKSGLTPPPPHQCVGFWEISTILG
jgi:hypothetical protein